MEEVIILLPETITLLRSRRRPSIIVDSESFSLYFDNMIHPLRPEYDVVVDCRYGGNFGDCWRISDFPDDADSFPLAVRVFDEWGRKLAEKACRIELLEKAVRPEAFKLLCIGDSMTHRHVYLDHLAVKLANLRLIGSRSFDGGTVRHEGRGGWQLTHYMTCHADWWGGPSPFVFPEGISGRDYYGDKSFYDRLKTPDLDSYALDGYVWEEIREGQFFHDREMLFRHTAEGNVLADTAPRWAFSFGKYIERFSIEKPDAVSILMGANDLQNTDYAEAPERIARFMDELEAMIASIHEYDAELNVIVNLPVCGAEQYAWGLRGNGSAKRYRLNTMRLSQAILERWDGRRQEHVIVCPMRLFVDPLYGFDRECYRADPYSDQLINRQSNWVHPNAAGYCQMGDALACVVEALRRPMKPDGLHEMALTKTGVSLP